MTPTEVLIEARKLCETKWGKGKGQCGPPNGLVCPDMATGIIGAESPAIREADRLFQLAIEAESDREVWAWNDHPDRTLADVLAAFDRAIEMSKGDDHG